jgi:hypothetical protein
MKFLHYFFLLILFVSCQNAEDRTRSSAGFSAPVSNVSRTEPDPKGMANPLMLTAAGGADIGRLLNAYYRTGQVDKMIPLFDRKTKLAFTKEQLRQMLINLQFGYDMKLSGSRKDGNKYTINYVCQINQTKVVKVLDVIVENDTARVVPNNLKAGLVFK